MTGSGPQARRGPQCSYLGGAQQDLRVRVSGVRNRDCKRSCQWFCIPRRTKATVLKSQFLSHIKASAVVDL